ncbi:MAG: heme A synthase [Sphingobacteriales bacterium]|nr:MAG: heme A synthase [Sphingobacteriales bacterium]
MYTKAENTFILLNLITIISLFVLILAGGVVRSSGSGMGCPDWPKCFDQYVPPTDISQLPADYQTKYVAQRVKKNERFASLLSNMGYDDLAIKIRNDETITIPDEFNATKTYTEYINRLIGALTGFFMLISCFFVRIYIKKNAKIFWFTLFNLVLVFFQAWLGSIVVSTNLLAWVITLHILVALAILAVAIYTYHTAKFKSLDNLATKPSKIGVKLLSIVALIITVFQITLGTHVRETVDFVVTTFPSLTRNNWVAKIGESLNYHRDLAVIIFVLNAGLYLLVLQTFKRSSKIVKFLNIIFILIVLQMLVGGVLSYLSFPPTAQALHILFASLLFGAQFYVVLLINQKPFINYTLA